MEGLEAVCVWLKTSARVFKVVGLLFFTAEAAGMSSDVFFTGNPLSKFFFPGDCFSEPFDAESPEGGSPKRPMANGQPGGSDFEPLGDFVAPA